jgi:copper homeostasis protein
MGSRKILKEACVESLQEAMRAEKKGADRIELCDDLSVGGITPGHQIIQAVKNALNIPVMVMIRCRGGVFTFNAGELKTMKRSIDFCKSAGVRGIVFGFLTPDHQIDTGVTSMMATYAYPLEITFHKAIDETPDPVESVKKIMNIKGITRILTSGGKETALEGADTISRMIEAASGRLIIMAAGRVTGENLERIASLIPGKEFHGRKIVGEL